MFDYQTSSCLSAVEVAIFELILQSFQITKQPTLLGPVYHMQWSHHRPLQQAEKNCHAVKSLKIVPEINELGLQIFIIYFIFICN